jgi:hypothetical protein
MPCAKPLYWRSLGGPVWVLGGGLLAARECVAMGRARACIASAELSMRESKPDWLGERQFRLQSKSILVSLRLEQFRSIVSIQRVFLDGVCVPL